MGSLSVSTHRGLVHWQGPLLLVSLLTFLSPLTTAEIGVVSAFGLEGSDALLRIHNKPPEVVGITWYKGSSVNSSNVIAFYIMTPSFHLSGPEYSGIEMITDDGSLLLKNVTMKNGGPYTVVVHLPGSKTETGTGWLHVYDHLTEPVILATRQWAKENEDDAIFTCFSDEPHVYWLFNDSIMFHTKRKTLTLDGKTLIINPVRKEDAGFYKCVAQKYMRRVESWPIELHVQRE